MPIFKDTVALEACPAKTAETVSYGATFAVLGWLLLSNYSGLGYAEQRDQAITSAESPIADTFAPAESILNTAAAYVDVETLNETPFSTEIPIQLDAEGSNFVTLAPAWHADLDPYQHYESQAHQRTYTAAGWNGWDSDADQQIAGFIEGLVLPVPLIDTAALFDAKSTFEIISNSKLASNALDEAELIREITVMGTGADRLTNRPDNVQRPQIPRPYRAQEIRRSFVLPPRIQALKP
jgi:hypothetical protein